MDFEITPEQEELRSSVRGVLEQECPISGVREWVERGIEPAEPWASAGRLGWTAIDVPERFGGLGLGFTELALVLEEHGRCLAPGPFLPTVSHFAPAVREAGDDAQCQRFLGAVAEGRLSGSLAAAGDSLRARPDGDAWILDGTRQHVFEGDLVDELVIAASVEAGDGVGLFVVPRATVKSRRIASLDASRSLATVEVHGVRVEADRTLGAPGGCAPALARALEEATVALALEMVGTCQAIFDTTLAYARHREQFGQPIGSFQAIQHKFADMFGELEKARATGLFAAMTIAEDDPRRALASSMAKVAAGSCQRRLAREGIQIHGGIGFTWEQDLHLFAKRAKSGEALLGTSATHRARIAELLGV